MKKVLILANSSVGLYSFRNELLLELTNKYEVYASLPDDVNVEELKAEGIKVIETPINRRGVNPVQDLKLLMNYLKLLKEINPDVVLSYTIKPNVYGGVACQLKKVPYLANVTGLGSALENPGLLQTITKFLYKMGLRGADTVFMQNQANLEFFENNHMCKAPKVLLPGSGVNTDKFSKQEWPEEKNEFIFISRIMKEKGIEEYLYCAQKIREEFPQTRFHILGGCEESYEERLKQLNDEGTIIYHGSVKDVRPYLKDVRCIIHPSYHEGMSNVCLEAASSGKVVITTDKPGCRETVVDGVSGFTVSVQGKEELVEAVKKYLNLSDEEKKQMGDAGRKHVEDNFDRRIVINQYMTRIAKIVD